MPDFFGHWQVWALLAACFAALTAIFAKVGVSDIPSDLATLLRTVVVIAALTVLVHATGQWRPLGAISAKSYVFLFLSGLATAASWACYFRALKLGDVALVAPIDKLSVVIVAILGVAVLGERVSLVNWIGVLLISGGAVLVAVRP